MLFFKRNYKLIIILIGLLIILAYVTNINAIPSSMILFRNEELNIKAILGVKIEETVEVGANISEQELSNKRNTM